MRHLNSSIYVDWLDPSMPARTCERTAENIKNLLLSKNIRNFVNDKASNPISNHEKSNLCRISSRCWSMKEITIIKQ